MSRTLTLFPAPDDHGKKLAGKILGLGRELGFQCRAETEYSIRAGARAMLCDDVTIYDLTTDGLTVGAFRALTSYYSFFDHVLLVSRTPLPFNVLPVKTGGAPPYPYPARRLPDGEPVRVARFTVDGNLSDDWVDQEDYSLLVWLRRALEDLVARPSGPRLPREESYRVLWPNPREISRVFGLGKTAHFANRPGDRVFLSYRGQYFEDALQLSAAAAVESVPGSAIRHIRVVSPSEFALERELLSAGRRWMIITYLRLLIFTAPEFWIYATDDYLGSWWTLAELVLAGVAISKGAEGVVDAPRLRIFQPETGRVTDEVGDLLVRMSKRDRTMLESISVRVTPGTSVPTPRRARQPLPRRLGGLKLWDNLLIDRRVIEDIAIPYAPTVKAFVDGMKEMVSFSEREVMAAVAANGTLRTPEGTQIRVAEFIPRLVFTRPSARHPERPVLRRLPTYYALQ